MANEVSNCEMWKGAIRKVSCKTCLGHAGACSRAIHAVRLLHNALYQTNTRSALGLGPVAEEGHLRGMLACCCLGVAPFGMSVPTRSCSTCSNLCPAPAIVCSTQEQRMAKAAKEEWGFLTVHEPSPPMEFTTQVRGR